jgi:hypothetical protein
MNLTIRAPREFGMGLLYLMVGTGGLWYALDYPIGKAARMGPGYLPCLICGLLILFGVISIVRAVRLEGEPIGAIAWRPLLLVHAGVFAFAALCVPFGFVPAVLVLILISALGSDEFRLEWSALLGVVVLTLFCALVFVYGLGLPLPLLGTIFTD